jgi:peptidoglycan hydrolase-like protein with peptidoglycan-binding domain
MITFEEALEALDPVSLGMSASGQMVLYLQIALQDLGHYTGALDGQFGQHTQTALCSFQEHVGVPPTGEFDMASWYALNFWLPKAKPAVRQAGPKLSFYLKKIWKGA